jgi:hypothetical protein
MVLSSCAHGVVDELPTAPGPRPAAIASLTITPVGGGTLIAGHSAQITSSGSFPGSGAVLGAFAHYDDGSGKYVEAGWSTSDPSVLVVDGSSLVPLSRGTAVITARAEGLTATETFTVQPNMAGAWAGRLVIDQCEAGSGSMDELICANIAGRQPGALPVGASVPIAFEIHKSGDDLTATTQLGDLRGVLRGSDRGRNFLTLKGDLTINRTTITIVYWDAQVRTDVMEGWLGFEVRIEGMPSHANVTAHFDNVTRR